MSTLTTAERELVALGASLASNCAPCIAFHVAAAQKAGLGDAQIAEAIALAQKVREVPARAVLEAATRALPGQLNDPEPAPARCCPGGPRERSDL